MALTVMKNFKWIIIFAALCAVCAAVWIFTARSSGGAVMAEIKLGNEVVRTIDLSSVAEPYEFTVETDNGGYNVIRAERGRIAVVEADCQNNDCVKQGWISGGAAPIVCLPHRLMITLVGTDDGIDAVAGGS